ncbi:hypothetical protein BH11PSE2_BH11PSE2_06850 [soil metagenome]
MRRLVVPTLLIIGLALGQSALAATAPAKPAPAAAKPATTAPKPAASPAKAVSEDSAKKAACEKTWTAQKTHKGKHKAFVAACVAKG